MVNHSIFSVFAIFQARFTVSRNSKREVHDFPLSSRQIWHYEGKFFLIHNQIGTPSAICFAWDKLCLLDDLDYNLVKLIIS